MRKNTVNLITLYAVFMAIANIALLSLIIYFDVSMTERFFTLALSNLCFIFIARDIEKFREGLKIVKRKCSSSRRIVDNKNQKQYPENPLVVFLNKHLEK